MRNPIALLLFVATILLNKWALTQRYELCASDIASESVCRPEPPEMDVAAAFIEACIVNEILPKAPEGFLGIGFTTALANLGNRIDPVRTILAPNLYYFDEAIPTANYTLIIIDSDVPSRVAPALRSYLNNLCVNIPGNQLDQRHGFSAAPWIGLSPSPGSGEHRAVGLLFQQEGYINTNDRYLINLGVTRVPFDLAEFVEKYCLGTPVAGNYWLTSIPVDYEACCTGGACAENQLCTTNQLCTRNQQCTANQLCASASTNACTRCR